MIYELTHATTYEYTQSVALSHHVLRLHPRGLGGQKCLKNNVELSPHPAVIKTHIDYFGNQVTFVTVEGAHKKLVVTARSEVEVNTQPLPLDTATPSWESVRDLCRETRLNETLEAQEFLYPSPQIRREKEFADYAAPSFIAGRPLLEAVMDLTGRIYKEFKFDAKATTVATPLLEVLKKRRGVCQDFAHLEIACLRAQGLPARYVSGYLETDPPPGKPRLAGTDASHAWVGFYCPGHGWIDVDPTNNLLPGHRHITVAWGRDYSDVSPIRGVILGSGDHSLKVSVDVIAQHEPCLAFMQPTVEK